LFQITYKNNSKSGKDHFHFPLSPDDDDSTAGTSRREGSIEVGGENVIDMSNRDPLTGSLHPSEKLKIMQLLERWEEPDRYSNHHAVSLSSSPLTRALLSHSTNTNVMFVIG
jgi:hypothetical protein